MRALNNLLNLIALIAWVGALAVLLWQGYGWVSSGSWINIPTHAAFSKLFGFVPVGEGFYPVVIIGVIMQQSLALCLALLGGACNGLAKIFDR